MVTPCTREVERPLSSSSRQWTLTRHPSQPVLGTEGLFLCCRPSPPLPPPSCSCVPAACQRRSSDVTPEVAEAAPSPLPPYPPPPHTMFEWWAPTSCLFTRPTAWCRYIYHKYCILAIYVVIWWCFPFTVLADKQIPANPSQNVICGRFLVAVSCYRRHLFPLSLSLLLSLASVPLLRRTVPVCVEELKYHAIQTSAMHATPTTAYGVDVCLSLKTSLHDYITYVYIYSIISFHYLRRSWRPYWGYSQLVLES